jgi:hypothetical protein
MRSAMKGNGGGGGEESLVQSLPQTEMTVKHTAPVHKVLGPILVRASQLYGEEATSVY